LFLRQVLAAAIDEEVQHRHRGSERLGFAPRAFLGGTFERSRNGFRIAFCEDALLEIQRVAALHDFRGPLSGCHALIVPAPGAALIGGHA
jgi:hypothetical protein